MAKIAILEVQVAQLETKVEHLEAQKKAGMFVQTGGELALLQLTARITELEALIMTIRRDH